MPSRPAAGQNTLPSGEMLFDQGRFKQMYAIAEIMASGKCTVPKHLQGNVGDCFAIASQAFRWGMDPYAVAQKTHLVNGTLGYESQLISAVVHALAPLDDRLSYEWSGEGENLVATVRGTILGELREKKLAIKNITIRNSPVWKTDPPQQLAYLATKYWARLYAPDVILGVYSPDELSHVGADNAKPINAPTKAAALSQMMDDDLDEDNQSGEQHLDHDPETGEVTDDTPAIPTFDPEQLGAWIIDAQNAIRSCNSLDDLKVVWTGLQPGVNELGEDSRAASLIQTKDTRKAELNKA
mgnify:FL=1